VRTGALILGGELGKPLDAQPALLLKFGPQHRKVSGEVASFRAGVGMRMLDMVSPWRMECSDNRHVPLCDGEAAHTRPDLNV